MTDLSVANAATLHNGSDVRRVTSVGTRRLLDLGSQEAAHAEGDRGDEPDRRRQGELGPVHVAQQPLAQRLLDEVEVDPPNCSCRSPPSRPTSRECSTSSVLPTESRSRSASTTPVSCDAPPGASTKSHVGPARHRVCSVTVAERAAAAGVARPRIRLVSSARPGDRRSPRVRPRPRRRG